VIVIISVLFNIYSAKFLIASMPPLFLSSSSFSLNFKAAFMNFPSSLGLFVGSSSRKLTPFNISCSNSTGGLYPIPEWILQPAVESIPAYIED